MDLLSVSACLDVNAQAIKANQEGALHDCVRTWSLVCLDFKARASAARVCSAGSADYISGRLFALLH